MTTPHESKAVANWFLERFFRESRECTQLHINKLVFIAHGWHLALDDNGQGLIAEKAVAWKHGPVIPSLRDEFRNFEAKPISRLANEQLDWDTVIVPKLDLDSDPLSSILLPWIDKHYGHLSAGQLIQVTHEPGSPWDQVTKGGTHIGYNQEIPNSIIRSYYTDLKQRL
ncbi:MAG: DUF4065 domain-containing protein [Fimbriimonas sp.]|nr:DUF4065 domain-containing protein [Fimbriimonas sp.]